MKFLPKDPVWFGLAVTLAVAAAGAVGGNLLGRANVRRAAIERLVQDATGNGESIGSVLDEAHSLFALLNSSNYPFCSDAEIEYFRNLIFHSNNLRDAGRMRNGKMECSALFGRKNLPSASFSPSLTQQDGTRIYRDLSPYLAGDAMVFVLQQGDSYVVEDPNFVNHSQSVTANSEITMIDTVSGTRKRPNGLPPMLPGAVEDRDWEGRIGDTLYATRCMPRNYMCSTAIGSFSEALEAGRSEILLLTALGSLVGAVVALVLTLLLWHNRSIDQQLRRAIRQEELEVVYQPIVDLASGQIVEAEALARWTDEDGFIVSPEVFVHIAEERGFVDELTSLVVRRALRDFGPTLRANQHFRLNINVTASDLANANFPDMLEESLRQAGVEPRSLVIEITEGSTAQREIAIDTIRRLRQRGHSIQIDDFGTGYSSLAYLKDLAVDAIKIDKAFTHAIGTHALIGDILPQILTLAEALNLKVIVEGIETTEQMDFLVALAKPVLGQGWLFGRPVPATELLFSLVASDEEAEALTGQNRSSALDTRAC